MLTIQPNWKFYRIGISDAQKREETTDKYNIKDIFNFKTVLKLVGVYNKVIDILKLDIEGEEKNILTNSDVIDYLCKNVKQLMFETHKNFKFDELVKLEKCFYMFYRHTRLFLHDVYGTPTGGRSEFQNGYHLDIGRFVNEINLSQYMFVNGELYFVNENFF